MIGKLGRNFAFPIFVIVFDLCGCQSIGGRKIAVQIRDASQIHGGEAVYMAGLRVGSTSEPRLVNGVAHVPVTIDRAHKEGFPGGSVFLLRSDPNEKSKMAFLITSCTKAPADKLDPNLFLGAPTRIEFVATCGAEIAKEFFNDFPK